MPGTVTAPLIGGLEALPQQLQRSLTWDRGRELARPEQITAATTSAIKPIPVATVAAERGGALKRLTAIPVDASILFDIIGGWRFGSPRQRASTGSASGEPVALEDAGEPTVVPADGADDRLVFLGRDDPKGWNWR